MSNPSVIAPIGMALATTRRILFQQFDLVRWLAIGFTAWLAALDGGLGSSFNINPGHYEKGDIPQAVWDWIVAHLFIVIPAVILLAAVGLVIGLLVLWVSCRGKFMFLDNVVGGRAEIIEPWNRFRAQGNSCFLFVVCFSLALVAVFILGCGLCLLVGWPDFSRAHFGWFAAGAIAIPVILYAMFGLPNASGVLPGGTGVGLVMAVSMCAYGVVSLAIFTFGEDVAKERGRGWTRTRAAGCATSMRKRSRA